MCYDVFEVMTDDSNRPVHGKYQANAIIKLSSIGGAAEDVSEFAYEITIQGKATVVASS